MGNGKNSKRSKLSAPRNTRGDTHSSWPVFSKSEIDAVVKVLKSGKVNAWTGKEVKLFEQEFAREVDVEYAIAVANGTVALELALCALDVGPGDEVVTTSRTFIATASAIVMRGATPVFADVDSHTQNITAESISKVITPRTRAIVVVHLGGWPCEMQPIIELAHDHGIKVIEDCAQAQGAEYYGRPTGSIGDIGTFSFCQDKIMTTGGEGGMLTTNDRTLWEKAWSHKDHGKSPSVMDFNSPSTSFRWVHDSFGTNWRMTEMQAAIGRVALRRIPLWLELRRRNAAYLTRSFQAIPALRIPQPFPEIKHAYYKFYAFVRPERLKNDWDRDRVLEAIMEEGAPCYTGTCSEVYLEKAFSQFGLQPETRLPVAQELGENSLMFLVHPTLNLSELEHTCRAVARVFERASVPWLGSSELLGQPGFKIADRPLPEVGSVFFQVDNESIKSRQPSPMDPFSEMDD